MGRGTNLNKDFKRNRKELDLLKTGLVKSWEIPSWEMSWEMPQEERQRGKEQVE